MILNALEKEPHNRYSSAASLGTVLAGLMSFSTEIVDQHRLGEISLITKYEDSIITPPRPETASLMTMLEGESIQPRGSSVFSDQSIPSSAQNRIQVVSKEGSGKVLTPPSGTVTIGRDKNNHIVLDDDKVSRKHAQITWNGTEYHVMDLNSSNGTFLENTKLLPGIPEVWKPNRNLRIGDTWLRLLLPTTDAQSVARSRLSSPSGSPYKSSSAGLVSISISSQQLTLEAGGSVTISISLFNQSLNVDHFTISIIGDIPSAWVMSMPSTVKLMPGEEKDSPFTLQVPRASQSRAGPYQITLKVGSQRDPSQFVEEKLTLTVAPYSQFRAELQPQRLHAERTGRLTIYNQGNIQETFTIQFKDVADELTFQLTQSQVSVPEGESAIIEYHAQPRRQTLVGGEQSCPFTVQISPSKGEPLTLQGNVLSRAWIPAWMPAIAIPLCLFLGGILFFLLPIITSPPITPSAIPITPSPTPILKPNLVFINAKEDENNGVKFMNYFLRITNWQAFPDYLFEGAPDLPPCGLNTNASRTWLDIYNADNDERIYGYCALKDLDFDFRFFVQQGETPPSAVYVILWDRLRNIRYRSNNVSIP